ADDRQWEPGGHVLDEVAGAGGQQIVHDPGGYPLHVALEFRDHPGGERARHDPAEAGMARVVHVDHRPEVLVELGRKIRDRRGAPAGREHLRVPARSHDVRVPDQGVVPRPPLGERRLGLGEERGTLGGAQRGEGGLPLCQGPGPELGIRQVDVRQRHRGVLCRHAWTTFCPGSSFCPMVAKPERTGKPWAGPSGRPSRGRPAMRAGPGPGMRGGRATAEYSPPAPAYHIARRRGEGELLAGAAEGAGLDAPVPACPGWRVRDLLKHLGYVHRWAAGYVREQHAGWVDRASEAEILAGGPEDDELLTWFREGHASLVRVLETADPDMTCWPFLEAPSPVAFWARRQAHETAIHRVDADQAAAGAGKAGGGPPFTPRFAVDGIDELIMGFVGRNAKRGSWDGPAGSLAIHAGDGAGAAADWRGGAGRGPPAGGRGTGPGRRDVTRPAAGPSILLVGRCGGRGRGARAGRVR